MPRALDCKETKSITFTWFSFMPENEGLSCLRFKTSSSIGAASAAAAAAMPTAADPRQLVGLHVFSLVHALPCAEREDRHGFPLRLLL